MNRPLTCQGGLRSLLARVHPVDKSLLIFMLVLLLQSAYSIFCPSSAGQAAGDIDIVVRTSAAAIFGYFLSANFVRHTASEGQTPAEAAPHKLEAGGSTPGVPGAPTARIGFTAEGGTTDAAEAARTADPPLAQDSAANCLQVVVASAIGLFCLVTLLVLRNLSQWDLLPVESDSVAASVVQFRDFVSGCVGFLIGCPTHSNNQTP